jgi:DNA-directed RNA polymerase subunit RPC12/RpoP
MATRLTVSTQCPTCGADLDFSEGTNAVQCRFCASNLLVTGRKHVLSYSIAPTLDKHRAVARVLLAHKEQGRACRVIKPQLYFVPYYRLTGHDLRWERGVVEADESDAATRHALLSALSTDSSQPWLRNEPSGGLASLFSLVSGAISDLISGSPVTVGGSEVQEAAPRTPAPAHTPSAAGFAALMASGGKNGGASANAEGRLAFHDGYVEKNFVATDLSEPRVYSLGVRPNVLRLNLFHQGNLSALGSVVAAKIPPATALERALMTATPQPLVFRSVLSRVLSLIYFPYWVVETERSGQRALTMVDAVSEVVLTRDAPTTLYETLESPEAQPGHAVGFRPLVCPNCGWGLPVRPDDVIFVCSSCSRAWQMYRDLLYEVAYQIADLAESTGAAPPTYLPFWRMSVAAGDDEPCQLTVPAFRYRRLRVLKELATALSQAAPAITPHTGPAPALHGCYYDQEDAVLLAQVAYISLSPKPEAAANTLREGRFRVHDIVLTWMPFRRDGAWLAAPFTGQQLAPQLLR